MNLSFLKIMCIIILVLFLNLPVNAQLDPNADMTILWNNQQTGIINLGNNLSADNTTKIWPATINPITGFVIERIDKNNNANLYVRVNDNFTDGYGNTISYDNFKYSDYGVNVPITSFTNTSTLVRANWRKKGNQPEYLPVILYLTVPYGTEPGNYIITIIHSLFEPGSIPPLSELSQDIDYNDSSKQTDNITGDANNTNQTLNISL